MWTGYCLVDIQDDAFTLVALMDPVQPCDPQVLSLTRYSDSSNQQYVLQLPTIDPSYLTQTMLTEGPVVSIVFKENKVLVSAQLTFLGTQHHLSVGEKEDDVKFHIKLADAEIDFDVKCVLNSKIDIKSTIILELGEHSLPLTAIMGRVQDAFELDKYSQVSKKETAVTLIGTLDVGVGWTTGSGGLSIKLSGKAVAFNMNWELGEIGYNIAEKDLRSVQSLIQRGWEYVRDNFSELVTTWVRMATTPMNDAIRFIRETWEPADADLVRILSALRKEDLSNILKNVVRETGMAFLEALKLFNKFGFNNFFATKLLSDVVDIPHRPIDLPQPPSVIPGLPFGDLSGRFPHFGSGGLSAMDGGGFSTRTGQAAMSIPLGLDSHLLSSGMNTSEVAKDRMPSAFAALENTPAKSTQFAAEAMSDALHQTHDVVTMAAVARRDGITQGTEVVAGVPLWYATEVHEFTRQAIPISAPVMDTTEVVDTVPTFPSSVPQAQLLEQAVKFSEEELVAVSRCLRLAGYSDEAIQQSYMVSFGNSMPQEVLNKSK
jgi:hypothetical protein